MNWREFFRPTKAKIIILILILLLTYIIPKSVNPEDMGNYSNLVRDSGFGFPFVFYGTNAILGVEYKGFFILEFIINFLIFYLVACLLVLIHKSIRE